MPTYPPRGTNPWDEELKAYIDALSTEVFKEEPLPSAADLNLVRTPGFYITDGEGDNSPFAGYGHLMVFGTADGNQIAQVFRPVNSGIVFERRFFNEGGATWTVWLRAAIPSLINTFSEVQRFWTSGPAVSIRRTNGPPNSRQWEARVFEGDGSLQFLAVNDSGAEQFSNFRIYRDGSYSINNIRTIYGTGSPEGVHAAPPGSQFVSTAESVPNAARTWRKTSGTGTSGWVVEFRDPA